MDAISVDQQNLKSNQLLVAVAEGNWLETKNLLDEGAEVNLQDSDGNTPLHIAVNKGYLDIVKLLLRNKANVNILNVRNETAFDIVMRLNTSISNKKIIKEIQDFIIEQSFEILEEHVVNQESLLRTIESDVENTVHENESRKGMETSSIRRESSNSGSEKTDVRNETVDFYSEKENISSVSENAICMSEESDNVKNASEYPEIRWKIACMSKHILTKNREIEKNLKSCLELLCDLKKTSESNNPLLTYNETNIFIQVLDAFSCISLSAKDSDSKENKLLEDYLATYYPEFKRDLEMIHTMRDVLSSNSSKKFTLEDVSKYICLRSDKATILKSLNEYVEFLCSKIYRVTDTDTRADKIFAPVLPSLLLRTKQDLLHVGTQSKDILKDELDDLIKALYDQEEWTQDRVYKILFSFLVNISPGENSNGPSGLKDLTENLITKFDEYKEVPIMMKQEFKRAAFALRSILFKHYLAKEVYGKMYAVNSEEDINQLDEKLRNALLSVEMEFQENYKILDPKDQEISFEHNCFHSSVSQTYEDLALREFVRLYMKFLIIIDTPKIEKHYQIAGTFDFYDLGEEYEKFINLQQLKIVSPLLYVEKKEELRKDLRKDFVTQGRYLEEVCQLYIEKSDSPKVENQYEAEIINTISILQRLQSKYLMLNKEILFLYSQVLDLKENDDIVKIEHLVQKIGVSNENTAPLIREIGKLFKGKKIEIPLCGDIVKRDTVSTISNIYLTFSHLCNSYKIKFNSLEETFLDATFLNNLLRESSLNHDLSESKLSNYFPCKILLELKYTVPYITRTIINGGNINAFGKESLLKLSEILLESGSYIHYLNQLLKVQCKEIDFYEIICNKITENNLENFVILFEEPSQVTLVLDHLHKSFTASEAKNLVKLKRSILALLNKIAYYLCDLGRYEKALGILDIYYKEMSGAEELELLQAKRTEALVKFNLGTDGEDNEENFRSCLQILESIKSTIEKINIRTFDQNVSYLLTINQIAKLHEIQENYAKEFSALELLYQEIKLFAADSPMLSSATVASNVINHQDILSLRKSKLYYEDLIDHSFETLGGLRIGLLCNRLATASLKEANRSSSLRARKYYTSFLNINKEAYFVKYTKKNRLQMQTYDYCLAVITKNLGYVYSEFATLDFEVGADVAFQNFIVALKFFNESYQIKKGLKLDIKTFNSNAKSISYTIYQIIKCSYAIGYRVIAKQKLREVKTRQQRLFQAISSNQKRIFQLMNSDKKKNNLTF